MVSLVNDEGISWNGLGVNFIGIQQVDELRLDRRSLLRRYETNVIRCGTRSGLRLN